MKVEQLYTKCLAEATYYIMDNGEAAIIDPLREIVPYIEMAKADEATIKYIFLTHFHADFVSGHVDLAKATGATIVYGPTAQAEFEFHQGKDGEDFHIGDLKLKLLHTPGHTMESSSYLLFDDQGKEHCLFSGDTLFIGDVGRPDLAVTSAITKEDLAEKLYGSLQEKIMPLPDEVIIYPNHGKGSACGKNMSNETYDTLGHQKEVNYALDTSLSKEEFVERVLEGLSAPPQYFPENARMNKSVNKEVNAVIAQGLSPITISQYQEYSASGDVLLLDVRSVDAFTESYIPGSLFIGLDGTFAPWVGVLIKNINQSIILVAPEGREEEAIIRLSRIGYDNVLGYIDGGVDAWEKAGLETNSVECVEPNELNEVEGDQLFIDVRRNGEYEDNHIVDAYNLPLSQLSDKYNEAVKERKYYVYCAGGYRSLIAISMLEQLGFTNLININGGFSKILQSTISLIKCRKNCATCACSQ